MKEKTLVICSSCLYAKKTKKHFSDPKGTLFIFMDSCPNCNSDSLDPIIYLDKNLQIVKNEINL